MLVENTLNVYTDGSSFESPRAGGVGIRFILVDELGDEQTEDSWHPGYRGATNNQMELKACVIALAEARRRGLCKGKKKVLIHTDSMYVYENYKKAMFEWPKTRWHTRSGTPVLNTDLWKELVKAIKATGCRVEVTWVKGHSRDRHNKAADKLARQSAKAPYHAPPAHVSVRRKLTSQSIDRGSVPMSGQRLSIRVITCEYLSTQRVWKLKYEVISKASPDLGKVDIVFSDDLMKDGHSYYVRFNTVSNNPRVVKVFRELQK
jgi:ribonuclease HI